MSAEITLSDKAESLSRVLMFRRLSPAELEQLAEEVAKVDYKGGEIISTSWTKAMRSTSWNQEQCLFG